MDSKSGVPHFETYYSFFPQVVKHAEHQHEDTNYFDFRNTFFKKITKF